MDTINLTVNGISLSGHEGETILQTAQRAGIEIPTLCNDESVEHYGGCGLCVVELEGTAKLLRACSTLVSDGMVVHTDSPRIRQSRKIALELLMSDHEGDCRGPCTLKCPAGTDCMGYVQAIGRGDCREAVRIIKDTLPMPATIGRICPHPCEEACRRRLVEEPISIARLKSYAADVVLRSPDPWKPTVSPPSGKTVGIIGGGPAGLSAAYYLALKGHKVTIADAMPQMGGMLRYGIPGYRLPKQILDREISDIAELGVEFINNYRIGKDETFAGFRARYDAVIIAIGAWTGTRIDCAGQELRGVFGGIDFLREVNLGHRPDIGERVAVVGGGNTAMDACRTAIRLGAEDVRVIYRRTRSEMPAQDEEINEAAEEGVKFEFLSAPEEILGRNGAVSSLRIRKMELGEPDAGGRRAPRPIPGATEELDVDSVILALGQTTNVSGFEDIVLSRKGTIAADEHTFSTNIEGVFAIGDATNGGADIAVAACGEGHRAAGVIDAWLRGIDLPYRKPYVSEREVTAKMYSDKEVIPRASMAKRDPGERRHDFRQIELGLTTEQAEREGRRCLNCGCHDYEQCRLIRYANTMRIEPERIKGDKHPGYTERKLEAIERDQGKCILCGLCMRVCEEVAGEGILGLVGRGFSTVIKPEFNDPRAIAVCRDCLKCVKACPTGALRAL